MKILLVPALVLGGLFVTACDNDEPDVVITQAAQPAPAAPQRNNDGDSTTVSIGEDGVSVTTDNDDRTAVSVGDGGVTIRTDND